MPRPRARLDRLERCGRAYGALHLAVSFTEGIGVERSAYKVSTRWKKARRLPDPEFGAGFLAQKGFEANPVVCLQSSNLIGVDVDGEDGRELLEHTFEHLPKTIMVRSGRTDGGWHFWYRAPQRTTKFKVQFSKTIVLTSDGYFVAPPAFHATAEREYRFLKGRAPWEVELATFPVNLYAKLMALTGERNHAARHDDSSPILEGDRHAHLLRVAGAMRNVGVGHEAILLALTSENARRCFPPKTAREVSELARDIVTRYPPGESP